jgi:O-antigen polymerase
MIFGQQLEHDPSLKKPQRLFFILFGLLFLIAPFYYQPNLGGEGLFIPHNSTLWIVVSWIITSASFLIYKNKKIILPKYWFGLALLPLGALITGFIADNNNPTEWIVRISVIAGGYLFFLSLFQFQLNSRHIERSLYIILAMGLIAAAYGIIQSRIGAINLGFMPVSPQKIPVGIFQQINIQASLMATLLVLTFYLASRPAIHSFSLLIKITLVIAALAASYTIAISGSRVGLLTAGIALTLLLLGRWKLFYHARLLFICLVIAISLGGFLGKSGILHTADKVSRVAGIGGVETDIRWHMYSLSWELFTQAPLVGHGLGSFQKVFQDKREVFQQSQKTSLDTAPRFSHPHNEMIFWMVEGGLLSIIGILAAAVVTFVQLIKAGWQRGMGYAALLLPISLHTQVELPFYISNTPWLLLLFFLFVTHQFDKKTISTDTMSIPATKTIPIVFIFISLLMTTVLVKAQVANAGIVSYLKRNQSQPQYLISALNSSYFSEYTTYLLLRRSMILGLKENNTQPAQTYADWAVESLKVIPAITTYRDLVVAYDALGQIDKRNNTLTKALKTYPSNQGLLNLKTVLEKKDMKPSELKTAPTASQALPQATPQ